jgi:hypothetical protein
VEVDVSGTQYVDGMLVDWGEVLFKQKPVQAAKSTRGATGLALPKKNKPNGGAGGKGASRVDASTIRSKIGSITKRTPEVMVKISGGGKGMKQIKDHLDYISRNGKLDVEDQDGSTITGRDELLDLRDEWRNGGFRIPEDGTKREAFNIVFSMPEGTDPLAVKKAVRDFAAREFSDHQYVMALHTFDTDPDSKPSKHPHVHLCVKAMSLEGTRLNPRKADLHRWREGFAEALREHGVEAAATNRQQRLKQKDRGEKQAVRQMKQRGQKLDKVGTSGQDAERLAKAKRTEVQVLKGYREIAKALASSENVEDRKLAVSLVHRLGDKQVQPTRSTENERDRGNEAER